MRGFDLGLALLALDVVGDEVHRAGAIERQDGVDIFDILHIELPADADHAAGFDLEDGDGFAAIIEAESRLIA